MTQQEAYQKFRQTDVPVLHQQMMAELEQHLEQQMTQIEEELRVSFQHLFEKIVQQQKQSGKGEIAFLVLSVLRTSLLCGHARCLFSAYDERWYADPEPVEQDYDGWWLFSYLNRYGQWLEQVRRKYIGNVSRADAQACKMEHFNHYKHLLTAFYKKNLTAVLALAQSYEIARSANFEIRVGEYFDRTESIWRIERENNHQQQVQLQLQQRYEQAYAYRHYHDLDLSYGDYQNTQMVGTRYERVDFSNSKIKGSTLLGTTFFQCDLLGVDFTGACVSESSFSESNLNGAIFRGVKAGARKELEHLPTQFVIVTTFAGADLSNVDFTGSDLSGCDFRGAILSHCNWTGATLLGAKVDRRYISDPRIGWSEQQKGEIFWE